MDDQQDIQNIFTNPETGGDIFISNLKAALNIQTIKNNQIIAVITVARGAFLPHKQQQLKNYLYLPADDKVDFNLSEFFNKSNIFIEKHRKRGNVLVHCVSGYSRSAALIIAYIMRRYKYSYQQAYKIIKKQRPRIKPNSGFVQLLQKYEKQLASNAISKNHNMDQVKTMSSSLIVENKKTQQKQLRASILPNSSFKNISLTEDRQKLNMMVSNLKKDNQKLMDKINDLRKTCMNRPKRQQNRPKLFSDIIFQKNQQNCNNVPIRSRIKNRVYEMMTKNINPQVQQFNQL